VKLFGWFALSTGLTVAISYLVTNALTRPIMSEPRIAKLLDESKQVSSVIASLFWTNDDQGKRVSSIIKWTSLAVIGSIVWLECTAFVDFSFWMAGYQKVSGEQDIFFRFLALFLLSFFIIYFVLRYGVRGFVFADLLHSPLIGLAAVVLLFGAWFLALNPVAPRTPISLDWFTPLLASPDPWLGIPFASGIVFALHVLILNTTQIVCSEHHWFRLWLMGEKELQRQRSGSVITAAVWILMLPIGFVAFQIANAPGEAAIAGLLGTLGQWSVLFLAFFWVGATAALFSTADVQVYSALLVNRFDVVTGELNHASLRTSAIAPISLAVSVVFAGLYTLMRVFEIPLEKILFSVVPFVTVLLPAFVHFYLGREVRAWVLGLSITGYLALVALGFVVAEANFFATLSAVFVPVVVTFATLKFVPRRGTDS
jgi:hypothetical protein